MQFIKRMNTKEYAEKLKLMIIYEEVFVFAINPYPLCFLSLVCIRISDENFSSSEYRISPNNVRAQVQWE